MTVIKLKELIKSDQMNYVVILTSCGKSFGFDLKIKKQRRYIEGVINDQIGDQTNIVGWMSAKEFPDWADGYADWMSFLINSNECAGGGVENKVGSNGTVESANESSDVNVNVDEDDVSSSSEESIESSSSDVSETSNSKSTCNSSVSSSEASSATSSQTPKAKVKNPTKKKSAFNENEKVMVESSKFSDAESISSSSDTPEEMSATCRQKPKAKVKNSTKKNLFGNDYDNSIKKDVLAKNSDSAIKKIQPDMSIFGGDLFSKAVSQNLKDSSAKSSLVDIYVSGPFLNNKRGLSYWSVTYGGLGDAWMLLGCFMSGYVRAALSAFKDVSLDLDHSATYHDINIRKVEFGEESVWKRRVNRNGKKTTTGRMTFVFSSVTSQDEQGLSRLKQVLDCVCLSMKRRVDNPVGKLLWEYIGLNLEHIHDHLMKGGSTDEIIEEKITSWVDTKFNGGYSLRIGCHMDQFMVDYDIIRILKDEMGFRSWAELKEEERGHCFKRYSSKFTLPGWNTTEEERY